MVIKNKSIQFKNNIATAAAKYSFKTKKMCAYDDELTAGRHIPVNNKDSVGGRVDHLTTFIKTTKHFLKSP